MARRLILKVWPREIEFSGPRVEASIPTQSRHRRPKKERQLLEPEFEDHSSGLNVNRVWCGCAGVACSRPGNA